MIQDFVDYGSWNNLLKGNYRKGANILRSILTDPDAASQMVADGAAVMAIYGDTDYADGSCLCANVIGNTDFAPAAFNHYLNLIGVSDYDTWAESAADSTVFQKILENNLGEVVSHSPKLAANLQTRTLSADSWDTIRQLGAAGSLVYSVGDTKNISISGIGTMTMEIAAFNSERLSPSVSAKTAPITFLSKELLYENYKMDSSSTFSGGFSESELFSTLNFDIYGALPSDLVAVIQSIFKWSHLRETTGGEWAECKLWIPARGNIFSPTSEEKNFGGVQTYPIFTDQTSRVKSIKNGSGAVSEYWSCSQSNTSSYFATIGNTGNENSKAANTNIGVCFGFCV